MTTAELRRSLSPRARAALDAQISAAPTKAPRPATGGVASLRQYRQPGKMTKTERLYADRLNQHKTAGLVRSWRFERVNLKLDDPSEGRSMTYRPDFLVWHSDGSITLDEVKGGYIAPKGMVKFRAAVDIYPELHFRLWQYSKGGWRMLRESEGHEMKAGPA